MGVYEVRDRAPAYGSYGKDVPRICRTYDSMMDYCDDAKNGLAAWRERNAFPYYGSTLGFDFYGSDWANIRTWDELENLCINGWEETLPETLGVVERAVQLIEKEIEQFEPVHALSGMDVDVAAAVAGLPEDMIDYPLTRVSNLGTTVTVLTDVQCHGGIRAQSIIRRGRVIVALALALESCGHQTELWVSDEYTTGDSRVVLRTRVKGPNDYIDPARLMFAYAHPAVQRGLGFVCVAGLPRPWSSIANHGYGNVSSITKDMPEGTLYIEPLFRYTDSANLDIELRAYLAQIGLLDEEDL